MKNAFLLASCILLLLAGCKEKEAPKPKNTITATVSGVDEDFSIEASATRGSVSKMLYIQGKTDKGRLLNIELDVMDKGITAGTYISSTYGNKTGTYESTPANFKGIMRILYSDLPLNDYEKKFINHNDNNPNIIVITNITDSDVQGTFYAELSNTNGVTKGVYNGKFDVQIR